MGYNPCYCWNLKDGCITIGIWSLVHSLMQIGLFSWQSYILHGCRYLLMIEYSFNNCQDWCPCAGNDDIGTTHTLVEGIFIIQIIILIASFFLLFASGALIYGIHTNSKHLVWPWFPCITISIIASAIYCVLWWAGNVESYWLVLTIIEFLSILVNVYCLLCIIVQYRRILKGYIQQDDDEYKPKKIVYEYRPKDQMVQSKIIQTYPEKKPQTIEFSEKQHHPELIPPLSQLHQIYTTKEPVKKQTPPGGGPGQGHGPATVTGSPEFKAKFTEAWINGVNNYQSRDRSPNRPIKYEDGDERVSPDRLYGRAKSLGDLQESKPPHKQKSKIRSSKSKESVSSRSHSHHRHHHHQRCRHISGHSSSSSSSIENAGRETKGDDGESEVDDKSSRKRNRSTSRHQQYSDSDTGYSASSTVVSDSEPAPSHSHRHHRCKHRHKHEKSDDQGKSRNRRPRDVKRDDRRRLEGKYTNDTIDSTSTTTMSTYVPTTAPSHPPAPKMPPPVQRRPPPPPPGGVPVLPTAFFGGPPPRGGVSIPQHIVIPPRPDSGDNQGRPQKYQINSEITIRYNNEDGRTTAPGQRSSPSDQVPRTSPSDTQVRGQRATPSSGQGQRSSPSDQIPRMTPSEQGRGQGQRSTPSTTPAGPVNTSQETGASGESKTCISTAV